MLRIAPLSRQDQRTLRQWQDQANPRLAQRARLILWAAQGWSVPDLARVFHCCRRRVRRWLHAFLGQGLAGGQGHPIGRPPHARSSSDSAMPSDQTGASNRLVPVVPLSVPEVRRIFNHLASMAPGRSDQFWHWSTYRRYKQALAMRSHFHKHDAKPPDFEYLRLSKEEARTRIKEKTEQRSMVPVYNLLNIFSAHYGDFLPLSLRMRASQAEQSTPVGKTERQKSYDEGEQVLHR